jgi:hypothetical protein
MKTDICIIGGVIALFFAGFMMGLNHERTQTTERAENSPVVSCSCSPCKSIPQEYYVVDPDGIWWCYKNGILEKYSFPKPE